MQPGRAEAVGVHASACGYTLKRELQQSRREASLQLDEDRVAFDPHWQRRLADRRAQLMLAGADIELPSVPGAGDDAAGYVAFG